MPNMFAWSWIFANVYRKYLHKVMKINSMPINMPRENHFSCVYINFNTPQTKHVWLYSQNVQNEIQVWILFAVSLNSKRKLNVQITDDHRLTLRSFTGNGSSFLALDGTFLCLDFRPESYSGQGRGELGTEREEMEDSCCRDGRYLTGGNAIALENGSDGKTGWGSTKRLILATCSKSPAEWKSICKDTESAWDRFLGNILCILLVPPCCRVKQSRPSHWEMCMDCGLEERRLFSELAEAHGPLEAHPNSSLLC